MSTKISQVLEFYYLRAALMSEAARSMHTVTITVNNYAVTWDTWLNRYLNKAILRKKHTRALLKHPKIPNNNVEALHTKVFEHLG